MLIEFDPDKDRINQLEHGVSMTLAERIDMRNAMVVDDPRDFEGETRQRGYVTIDGRLFSTLVYMARRSLPRDRDQEGQSARGQTLWRVNHTSPTISRRPNGRRPTYQN